MAMDQEKIRQAVRLFLEGIGEDPDREGLIETPDRVARMSGELFAGMRMDAAEPLSRQFALPAPSFPKDRTASAWEKGNRFDLVVEKEITFYSTCEHHLLPFYGTAAICYLPADKVVGLSKLARTVEVYARRPQLQERLTGQIADALMEYLHPQGVMVKIEAEHMCMTMRGVKKPGAKTLTVAGRGICEEDPALWQRFWAALQ